LERTISGVMGKGSVNHNSRAFTAKNVDKQRSQNNVEFCNEDIKEVYHKLFDDALERYNAKQKRSDRKIDDYYDKIRRSKQEKLFHEVIFQIGNRDDMNARDIEGRLAKKILTQFMEQFQERNPNLYVFSAHLHMDEETPHLHIDFVPFIRDSKRGLDTRVTLKGALMEQGFPGGTRGATECNQWIESEKQVLAAVMKQYGIEWLQKGTHNKHLSVLDFEKQERSKEVEQLEVQKQEYTEAVVKLESEKQEMKAALQVMDKQLCDKMEAVDDLREELKEGNQKADELAKQNKSMEEKNVQLQEEHSRLSEKIQIAEGRQILLENVNQELVDQNQNLKNSNADLQEQNSELERAHETYQNKMEQIAYRAEDMERDVRKYEEDPEWKLPEASSFGSAKSYRENCALPLWRRLVARIKKLSIENIGLIDMIERLRKKISSLENEVSWLRDDAKAQNYKIERLEKQEADYNRVKRYMGEDRVQQVVDTVKVMEEQEREQKRLNRSRGWSR